MNLGSVTNRKHTIAPKLWCPTGRQHSGAAAIVLGVGTEYIRAISPYSSYGVCYDASAAVVCMAHAMTD